MNLACRLLSSLVLVSAPVLAATLDEASGRQIMDAVYKRHQQYPFVYEEQSMVLIDRVGNRETRRLRRYSRVEEDLTARFLLLFDSPEEVKGTAILAEREEDGTTHQSVFLPAFGNVMISNDGDATGGSFLGSDFSVENIVGEDLNAYIYKRQRDAIIADKPFFVVDVYPMEIEGELNSPLRRHFILKDSLYIARTDFFDDLGRLEKRQSHHDLSPVLGDMWRANMMLMEDFHEEHQTLIKIDRRVFSSDYVPRDVFTADWLYDNAQAPEETQYEPIPETEAVETESLETEDATMAKADMKDKEAMK